MSCSAATQADCPQPQIPLNLTGASPLLSFSEPAHLSMYIYACMRVAGVILSSETTAITRAKQSFVYLCPGDLYAMWPDASLQTPRPSPASPWPSFSTRPLGTVNYFAPPVCPQSLVDAGPDAVDLFVKVPNIKNVVCDVITVSRLTCSILRPGLVPAMYVCVFFSQGWTQRKEPSLANTAF